MCENDQTESGTKTCPIRGFLKKAANEPFRLYFLIGLITSCLGVLLWPSYYMHMMNWFPAEAHSRLMICGFGGFMVLGFIGTAGPRMLGSSSFHLFELLWHGLIGLLMVSLYLCNRIPQGDLFFGIWILGWLKSFAFRLVMDRTEMPPPGFPVAMFGIAAAMISAFYLSTSPLIRLSPATIQWCRLFLFQGFLWLPVMGIAPYLLPRFFMKKSLHAFPDGADVPKGWWKQFAIASLGACGLLVSFWLEVNGSLKSGMMLRAFWVAGYLLFTVPGLLFSQKGNGLTTATRIAFLLAVLSWLGAGWWWPLRVGMLHIGLIGGLGLLMLSIATRVILGHNGRHDRLTSRMRWIHVGWFLMLLTALTRASADWLPKIKISHHYYAACLWVIIVTFWLVMLRRERKAPRLAMPEMKFTREKPKVVSHSFHVK
jgi:uncharacterized protein involved in response to NO